MTLIFMKVPAGGYQKRKGVDLKPSGNFGTGGSIFGVLGPVPLLTMASTRRTNMARTSSLRSPSKMLAWLEFVEKWLRRRSRVVLPFSRRYMVVRPAVEFSSG